MVPYIHILDTLDLEVMPDDFGTGRLRPVHFDDQQNPFEVHFRQGSLDGACGLYAVVAALSASGAELTDRKLSRAAKEIAAGDALFSQGTNSDQLNAFVKRLVRGFCLDPLIGTGPERLHATVSAVRANAPVLLLLRLGKDRFHWACAIGFEIPDATVLYDEEEDDDSLPRPDRLYLLDPGGPPPTVSYWNAVMTRRSGGGPVRYSYGSADGFMENVTIVEAYQVRKTRGRQ